MGQLMGGRRLGGVLVLALMLAGCPKSPDPAPATYTVGGTVSGLSGTLTLQNNGGDNLTLTANGAFSFGAKLADRAAYNVAVLTQPAGQTCTVANGTGMVSRTEVTGVSVICSSSASSRTVGGSVTGLAAGTSVVLQNNGGDNLTVSTNGSFTFATAVAGGATYSVSVLTPPSGQNCSVANGTGSVSTANITSVSVTCASGTYTVGGTVSGLSGTVVLQNNGGDNLTLGVNGPFAFAQALTNGSTYSVTVFAQPAGQACAVTGGSGALSGANIGSVSVACGSLGSLALFAGNLNGIGTVDGTGSAARFHYPASVAADGSGNVYVADTSNNTVRKITSAGVVTTLAGTAGSWGSADGTGSAARFNYPEGIATDSSGNVYVADTINHTIRKITPTGVVTTLAGTAGSSGSADGTGSAARFSYPRDVATDNSGNVYVADADNYTIRKITPAGAVTTLAGTAGTSGSIDGTGSAARFRYPQGVATDSSGNVYVGDSGNGTIRKITPAGVVTTLAGTAGTYSSIDGTGSTAGFTYPRGVATDGLGNLYVADERGHTIRKVTPAAVVTTLAGTAGSEGWADGTGAAAQFWVPDGAATDSLGNVYVTDPPSQTIRKITPAGVVTTLAGTAYQSGSTDGIGSAARFWYPGGVATDSSGNVYVADSSNHTIRKIAPAGVVTTLAGTAGSSGSTDGAGSAARFNSPQGIATDSSGNVYVGDAGNYTIRKITPAGVVTTLAGTAGSSGITDGTGSAAQFIDPRRIATDNSGNVYVVDNTAIRRITPAGVVTTLAGTAGSSGSADGTGSAARFGRAYGIATDSSGNVYVADRDNHTIRKITPAGVVSTVAGLPGKGIFVSGTLPGMIAFPVGVAVFGKLIYVTSNAGVAVIQLQ